MDFLKLAKKRYACRKYLSRQVEPEKLELILEAGRVAPTGANRQPQRLVVVQSKEGMERLARCTRDFGAPTAVIVCADTSEAWTRKYDGKNISDIDASIVTDHMMLAAASLNLDTLWICMFKPEAVREEFALRLRLLVVLFADDNLGGHGPYRVDGRHVFVADRRPDTGAVEHRLGDLGLCDGVVLRQYNQRVVLHNSSVFGSVFKVKHFIGKMQ